MSSRDATLADPSGLEAAVEAILFAAGEPVHAREIAAALSGLDESQVDDTLAALQQRYENSPGGLLLERVAGAWRLATKPEVGALVRQFFRQRNRTRLSPAALESLAIVAYKQPITAPEIQAIRGVDPSGPLKSLLEKKLIRMLGRKKVVGNPILYGTSKQFLVHFGLDRLEDLPSIDDFDQFLDALGGGESPLFAPPTGEGVADDDDAAGARSPSAGAGDDESE